jgi:putative ABC transport system permease protein
MIKNIADKLFEWYCHPDYYPDIKGDLEEFYHRNSKKSKTRAKWQYLLQVIGLFRPSLITPSRNSIIYFGMLRNYFKIGTRTLVRQKLFTFINVIGLAFGLSAFLLINEYVKFERSYDSFYKNPDQIYRVSTLEIANGVVDVKDAMTYSAATRVIYDELPEVLNYTTSLKFDGLTFRKGTRVFREKRVATADTNFLKIFTYPVLLGSANDMLKEPYSLVLTRSKARFYFKDENPIGQTLEVLDDFNRPFKVTGVIEDVPDNTHYKFDILLSHRSVENREDFGSWQQNNYYGYVVLDKHADYKSLNGKLARLSKKYLGHETSSFFNIYPLQDIHLHSDYTYEAEMPGSDQAVTFMSIISFFILIIAWVNYINLSTARAVQRAKEVGLRKVIGAFKSQLIFQFLLESLVINLIAAFLALIIAEISLPYYYSLIGTTLTNHVWQYLPFLQNLLVFFIVGTIVSGFYPALVLSGFKPAVVLKGSFGNSQKGVLLRKGLVVFQFAASITLIAGTLIINSQLQYMQNKDIGIAVDYVIGFLLPAVDDAHQQAHHSKVAAFKEELRNYPAIDIVGATSNLPGGESADINTTTNEVSIVGITKAKPGTTYVQFNDDNFLDAVKMQLIAGRDFDRTIKSDSMAIMANESFLRKFNITDPDSVLNEYIDMGWGTKYQLIGIVKDYNRMSLKSAVEPTVFLPDMTPGNLVVKLKPGLYQAGLDFVERKWKAFFPDSPLDYSFLDQRFKRLYQQDERFGQVYLIFSVLAILIAMLGLFGLSSFMAIQRTKEVGVRKVLGASVPGIIAIFYRDFMALLAWSALIGIPVVYYSMNFWLENYTFRITFPWLLSLAAILIVVVFALIIVGLQTYKVAVLNPAHTLKYE